MASPFLSPTTETCGSSETCRTTSLSPPQLDPNRHPSINRVPAFITKLSPEAYRPQVVSFGPYHHGEEHLLHMEEHKKRALHHFLERSGKTREDFLRSLREVAQLQSQREVAQLQSQREVAQRLEESYDALDPKWKDDDKFLELMITDGCFMLEIMRNALGKQKNDYAPNDPIFSTHRLAYIKPYIRRDMLLLENQLPMLVLEGLVAVGREDGEKPVDEIHNLILKFYSLDKRDRRADGFLHVLDVFRIGLLTPKKDPVKSEADGDRIFRLAIPSAKSEEADGDRIIRSATELKEAGILFEKSNAHSLEGICFGGGVLRLPVIIVDDYTESRFLNIMTFERLHIGAGTEVASYVTFMDHIINDERDVALLHAKGIIQNALGSDKAVAELFNRLCKEVTLESNNSLDAEQVKISVHCNKRWNRWRATLNRTYFGNPWTIVSLIAAIFLFALTIIQTAYTLLSYY